MQNVLPFPQPECAVFDAWWDIQFHKIGKALCKAKWDAITSPEGYHTKMMDKTTGGYVDVHLQDSPQKILEAQRRQNKLFFERHGYGEKAQAEKQFLRRPVTWLNQGGFLDE